VSDTKERVCQIDQQKQQDKVWDQDRGTGIIFGHTLPKEQSGYRGSTDDGSIKDQE
jgi:hypothetical protein